MVCINTWLKNYQTEISVLANIATITIPIVLAFLGYFERKRKEKEIKLENEKKLLIDFIKDELYPLEIDKYNFKEDKKDMNLFYKQQKKWLGTYYLKIIELSKILIMTSYTYMLEYFTVLSKLLSFYINNKSTTEDYSYIIPIFNTYIKQSAFFLQLDEKKYKKFSMDNFNNFLKEQNGIFVITMEILRSHPKYYKEAEKFIKEQSEKANIKNNG